MQRASVIGLLATLGMTATASALPVLQFDVNAFSVQATNGGGTPSAFGGLSHTGNLNFSLGSGSLEGIFIQTMPSGAFANAGLSGFTMTTFTGQIQLNNGMVTGGNLTLGLNNGDTYTATIVGGSGMVTTYVGGGYKLEALTDGGAFSDSMFGNVDVSPWFNAQTLGGLLGSLLQFNFDPDPQGAASSDMDIFVDAVVIPLPPAAYAGLGTLGGVMLLRRFGRRR